MELGKKIRHLRKCVNMKQKDLAKLSGISNSYLCDIESGRTQPSISTLQKISENLGVHISDLFK